MTVKVKRSGQWTIECFLCGRVIQSKSMIILEVTPEYRQSPGYFNYNSTYHMYAHKSCAKRNGLKKLDDTIEVKE